MRDKPASFYGLPGKLVSTVYTDAMSRSSELEYANFIIAPSRSKSGIAFVYSPMIPAYHNIAI